MYILICVDSCAIVICGEMVYRVTPANPVLLRAGSGFLNNDFLYSSQTSSYNLILCRVVHTCSSIGIRYSSSCACTIRRKMRRRRKMVMMLVVVLVSCSVVYCSVTIVY